MIKDSYWKINHLLIALLTPSSAFELLFYDKEKVTEIY